MADTQRHRQAVWRERHKVSLRELARRAGCAEGTLRNIELGGEPHLDLGLKLCRLTGLPPSAYTRPPWAG